MNITSRNSVFFTAIALTLTGTASAQSGRETPIEVVKVTDSVYMLVGQQSGNIGLCVGEDGTFMIDDQYARDTGKILAAASSVTDDPVKFLLNTHWHGDHVGGNENMSGEGAILIAQENVYVRMSIEQFSTLWDSTTPASPVAARPKITFAEELTLRFNGDEIHAFHVPHAHTDGDTIIHFRKNNVFHMGDTFFNGMYPFIDVDSGGTIDGVIKAAGVVIERANAESKAISATTLAGTVWPKSFPSFM